ncbi:MAG TPA: diguanylate cyclase, partial [Telluria sp.]
MTGPSDIAHWRLQIFHRLLLVVLILGGATAVPSILLAASEKLWALAIIDSIAMLWLLTVWRWRALPFSFRVFSFMAVTFAVGIALMLQNRPISQIYLAAVPVLAALLLGLRPAYWWLAATGAAVLAISLFTGGGLVVRPLIIAVNFVFITGIITLSCGVLLRQLAASLATVSATAVAMEAGRNELHALNNELRLTSAALARLNDMVLIATADKDGEALPPITFVNDAFLRRTGYTRAEVEGRNLHLLQGAETCGAQFARIVEAMRSGQPCNAELTSYTRSGDAFLMALEVMPFTGAGGKASHWVVVGRDITERRTAADAIHRLAYYDVLTGLPNRRYFMERLGTVLARAAGGQELGAVLYLDLDNFKNVYDARGHATGDALLGHVAQRLTRAVRSSDTVARIGGDEFVVLLEELGPDRASATRTALELAGLVMAALAAPLDLDGQPYRITASIGVALPLDPTAQPPDLLREADTAMYHAKAGGRNGVVLFESAMLAEAQYRLTLERDLARALERGELAMHLQLQVDGNAVPVGAELLMRWQRADGSWVRPDVFIPVAEASGMIVALGNWALRQACEAWLAMDRAGHPMPLSINVSPLQFRQPGFVEGVRAVLAETGAPPHQLIFEVTEGLLVEDVG